MATLGIKQNAWDAGTDDQHEVMEYVSEDLALGNPAKGTIGAVSWRLYDDGRWKPGHIAAFGSLVANQSYIFGTLGWTPPKVEGVVDRDAMRSELMDILRNDAAKPHAYVPWTDITIPDDTAEPWQYILDQQNCPNAVKMWTGVPDGFVPEVTE